jgi:hypothetical protein
VVFRATVSARSLGRSIALVGLTCGLLAVSLPFVSGEGGSSRYVQDGTVAAFLLIVLSLSSWLPAEVGSASLGAAFGAAAFGFFLFAPAEFAFDHLGYLDAGAWLGLCTLLIPIGALIVSSAEPEQKRSAAPPRQGPAVTARDPAVLLSLAGLALLFVGIWLPAESDGDSFWNLSFSGHALGLLMLFAALLNVAFVAATMLTPLPAANTRLVVAAGTFGLMASGLIANTFEALGNLGSGAWLEAWGGLLLLVGTAWGAPLARAAYEEVPASLSQSPR